MSASENAGETAQAKSFFCHSCQNEFRKSPDQDFLCPRCDDGFIEELPENSNNSASQNADEQDESQFMRGVFNDFSMGPFQMSSGNNNTPYFRIANEILGPIITGSLGGLASTSSTNEPSDGSSSGNGSNQANGGQRRRGGQRRQGPVNFEDILQEILVSITDGANNTGRAPMFFMGNPGDYAWGREGLDTIVTQLLNQMDNAGPPPLGQDKIAEIPKCEIVQEQVDSKLQCSVCWDDFQLQETVRQLPCSHVYHESCILPWLKLHGTCPICRKSLLPEEEESNVAASNAAAQVANQLRLSIGGQASTSHGANSSAMDTSNNHSSNSSENPSGNSSNRRRDDIDFDFD